MKARDIDVGDVPPAREASPSEAEDEPRPDDPAEPTPDPPRGEDEPEPEPDDPGDIGEPEPAASPIASKGDEAQRSEWVEIRPEVIQKVEAVFVEPKGYAEVKDVCVRSSFEQRVVLVQGPKHSGRLTTALRLALDLQREAGTGRIKLHHPTSDKPLSIRDLAGRQRLERGTVYIVRDVFDQGVREAEFSVPVLAEISASLFAEEAYLILTGVPRVHSVVIEERIKLLDAAVEDTAKVLENHLRYYHLSRDLPELSEEYASKAMNLDPKLLARLRVPPRVDWFCRTLCEPPTLRAGGDGQDLGPDQVILATVKRVCRDDPWEALDWFRTLSANARLFALLVGLFRGVRRGALEQLYDDQARRLRSESLPLNDPRQDGMSDLLAEIHARETETGGLAFVDQMFEDEVNRQLGNYHPLLWSVIGSLWNQVEHYKGPEHWEFRVLLGSAIGRVGVHAPDTMARMLTAIASEEHGGIASIAGFALREVAGLGRRHDPLVLDGLIRPWARSGVPNQMWSAAGAIWRVYQALASAVETAGRNAREDDPAVVSMKALRTLLTELAERFDDFSRDALRRERDAVVAADPECARFVPPLTRYHQLAALPSPTGSTIRQRCDRTIALRRAQLAEYNRLAIVRAVLEIDAVRPADAVALVEEWLAADEEAESQDEPTGTDLPSDSAPERKRLRMLGEHAAAVLFDTDQDQGRLLPERCEALLGLVGRVLGTREETVAGMLSALETWLGDANLRDRVAAALLRALNRARAPQRWKICRVLSGPWLRSGNPEVRASARDLIARSRLLDGAPVDLPGGGLGVLLVDASAEARLDDDAADAGAEIAQHLQAQVDLHVGKLGQASLVPKPDEGWTAPAFDVSHDLPRLLGPALEPLDAARAHYALVLHAAEPLDADDLDDLGWSGKVARVSLEVTPTKRVGVPVVSSLLGWLWFQGEVRRFRREETEKVVRSACWKADERFGESLAGRDPGILGEALRRAIPGLNSLDPAEVVAAVERLADRLDDPPPRSTATADPARLIAFAVQWLTLVDLPAAVDLLDGWLGEPDDHPKSLTALACSRRLFFVRVYPAFRALAARGPVPAVDPFGALLRLGPSWARLDDWPLVQGLLTLVRASVGDPAWVERVVQGEAGRTPELVQTLLALPKHRIPAARSHLGLWSRPAEELGETKAPAAAAELADWLELRLRLAGRAGLAPLPDGQGYGVIVLGRGRPDHADRDGLAKLAVETFKALSAETSASLRLAIFRAGESLPVAVSGDRPTLETLAPRGRPEPPGLVGPILDALPSERVRFVLLLANRPPVDGEDWLRDWERKGLLVNGGEGDPPRWAAGWEFIPVQDPRTASTIVARLKTRL